MRYLFLWSLISAMVLGCAASGSSSDDPGAIDDELQPQDDNGPIVIMSDHVDYSSNTSITPTVGGPCPPNTIRTGDPVVYKEDESMGGWCESRGWVNPSVPTDCTLRLHIGADIWHGGGRVIWKVNGYRTQIAPNPTP